MKTQIFPFWHNFYDEPDILHMNKILWEATNLFVELNSIALLGLIRKNATQKASIMLLNCLFQHPFPRAFVPSVAKSWKWHLYHQLHESAGSPRPAGDVLFQHPWLSNLELLTLHHGVWSGCFLKSTANLSTLYKTVYPNTQTGISMHVSPLPPPEHT